jgi:hypothetical protein
MRKLIFIIAISLTSCKKEEVKPTEVEDNPITPQSIVVNPTPPGETLHLFESLINDTDYIFSDTISQYGQLYYDNGFGVRISDVNPDSIKLGTYTNEYLIRNVNDYGLKLIHSVILRDGSRAGIMLGSTATQINTLEVTKIQNDSVWINYDVDWTYTHWLYTDRDTTGNIKCKLNGFKYR